jgi:hypothetical protein
MVKHLPFTALILLATLNSGHAVARCNNGQSWSRVQNLVATLTNGGGSLGMTACSSAGQGTQEEHHANGELWDYKCGNPGNFSTTCAKPAVDPRRQLGTWSVQQDGTPNATVTYDYTAFGNASVGPLSVFRDGTTSTYDFCDGNTSVGIFTLTPTTGTSRVCP